MLPLLLALGCDSLAEFKGDFSGTIVAGSFVRSCLEAETDAELRFNPAYAVGTPTGIPEAERNWLTLRKQSGEIVLDAPLDPISTISGDTLADFDFPGQKRLRNFMLMARPAEGVLSGRDVVVVVSLLATKRVELRVIARGGESDPPCNEETADDAGAETLPVPEYYGLFRLK